MAKAWKPVVVTEVDDLIAEDWWELGSGAKKRVVHIAVGRALPDPFGRDWYCPLLMEGFPPGLSQTLGRQAVYGVGPVDSTMNAFQLIARVFHEFRPSPAPRPRKPPRALGPQKRGR